MNISPMPIKKTLNLPSETPMLTKDLTNWLSDTTFGDNDQRSQSVQGSPSPPTGPASVVSNVSNSSLFPPPPISKSELSPVTKKVKKPFRVSRRHSISSIYPTSYNVPLNDVGSMPTDLLSHESTSSFNRVATDENVLTSAEIAQSGSVSVPETLQQQMHQKLQQQPLQHFIAGSPSQGGASVNQRLQQLQLQQLQLQHVHQQQLMQQQVQQQQLSQQQQLQQQQVQELQHFVGDSSSHLGPTTNMKQQQQQQQPESQPQSQRSSFHDELDELFRFSREFTLEDFLKDIQ